LVVQSLRKSTVSPSFTFDCTAFDLFPRRAAGVGARKELNQPDEVSLFLFFGKSVSGLLLWEITPQLSQYKMVVGIEGRIPTEAACRINKDITVPGSSPW
jgi:hypothetical protein